MLAEALFGNFPSGSAKAQGAGLTRAGQALAQKAATVLHRLEPGGNTLPF